MKPSNPPIAVCHLIHDLGRGGAEHVLVDLAAVASGAGFDMSVVSMMPIESMPYAEMLVDRGVTVHSLDLAAWWDPRGPRRLRRLLQQIQPEVLHSHLKHADVVAGRVAMKSGIPHVSTLHVIEDAVGVMGRMKRWLAMRSRRRSAAITIAVSDALRDWYLSVAGERPDRVVTVHNGIPDPGSQVAQREAVRGEFGIRSDAVVAAMVAVMRPGKGHAVLLESIPDTDPGVVFLLAGDGEEREALEELAEPLGDRVVFAGFRDDIPRVLAAADLLVLPTFADALPTAITHGLAAGLPIIASRVGGVIEMVIEGCGVLVPPGDAAALSGAVNELAADPQRRLWAGKAARERFEQAFSAGVWTARLRQIYELVLTGR